MVFWKMFGSFVVNGEPVPKARPRFVRKTGRTYTPQKSADYESKIRFAASGIVSEIQMGTIRLHAIFHFPVRKSWSNAKRKSRVNREHQTRPDLDNLVKAVSDGLNGVAYADDQQIAVIEAKKFWSVMGRTEIQIYVRDYEDNENSRNT
jgi:Holliday junction resolvase RusA-like endonuclease